MALEIPNIYIDTIDKSNIALQNTRFNINYYGCDHIINPYSCDILRELPNKKYDVIVSNPPYIPLSELPNLEHSVRYYDPLDALTDYADGMMFYQRIADISNTIINPGGYIILEFGTRNQEQKIINIFHKYNYQTFNDLHDKPRVIMFEL